MPANPDPGPQAWSWEGTARTVEEYDPDTPPPLPAHPPDEEAEECESPPPLPPGPPPPLPVDDPRAPDAAAAHEEAPPLPPEPYPGDGGGVVGGGDVAMEEVCVDGNGMGGGLHAAQAAMLPPHSGPQGYSAGAAPVAGPMAPLRPYGNPVPEPHLYQQQRFHDFSQQQQQQQQQMIQHPVHQQPGLFVAQQVAAAQQYAAVANVQHHQMMHQFQHHQAHHAAYAPHAAPHSGMPVPPMAPPPGPQGPVPPGPMGLPPPLARPPLPVLGVPPFAQPPPR